MKKPKKEELLRELLAAQNPELPLQEEGRGCHGSNDVGGQTAQRPLLLVAVREKGAL